MFKGLWDISLGPNYLKQASEGVYCSFEDLWQQQPFQQLFVCLLSFDTTYHFLCERR